MATKTLTVNGQPFYINRDRKAGVTELKNNETKVQGNPFVRLGTLGSFSATSNSFSSGTNTSGSNARVGVILNRALTVSETAKATLTITGTVDSITSSNGIGINPTQGTTGGGSWTPNDIPPALTTTGAFTRTFSLFDSNPFQGYLQGVNFSLENGEAIAISNLSVIVDSPDIDTYIADRTAPVIDSDPVGKSRPLLGKLVGDAAAAYSLRDLNTKQGDTDVVNVRRSADNLEKIFKAKDVPTIEDWTNGKQETTLPADVATAAVAYSLRKVKADYANDAVRIRRSSDDVEVNVAFDSEGKVSSSSPITDGGTELTPNPDADLGSTSATNLNGFLNETLSDRFSTVDYPSGIGSDFRKWSTLTATSNSFVATTGTFADNTARYNYVLPAVLTAAESASTTFRFSGTVDYTASGGTGFNIKQGSNATASSTHDFANLTSTGVGTISSDTFKFSNGDSGDFSFEFTGNGTNDFRSIVFLQTIVSSGSSSMSLTNLKFEIIKHGATVHTWYDQAGSNNAVQENAAYQPTIALSGALLADGVTFDGSNDFLQTSTQVLTGTETSANSMYAVINQASGDDGYICGSSATDVGGNKMGQSLYGAGSSQNKVVLNNGNDASGGTNDNITIIEGSFYLISSCYNNNNTNTLQTNGGTTGYANGSTPYDFNAGTLFTIGARKDSTTASTVLFTGSMKEIIAYDSDQLANRFKIESNINNYYGLYNDENEFSANPTAEVTPSAITLTNVSKTGFTAEISSTGGTKQINFPLLNSLVSGYDYFVSFDYTSTSTSTVGVKPRTAALGSASNDVISATNSGFYGGTGDSQHNGFDVNNTATILSFQTTANSFTFTVSNLRVSRIARNGFVQTWYDQSGNLRDAIQVSETKQPTIVSHGSVVKLNSKPAITFDGNDNFLEVDGTDSAVPYSFSPSGDMGMFIVSKQSVGNVIDSRDAGGDGVFLQQASANTTRFRYNASSNNIDVTATRDVRHLSVLTLDGTTLSASVDGGTATSKTVTAGVSTTKNLVLGKAFSGNNSNFVNGEIQEVIFYERKQTHNLPAIKANINNQYQIYS